MQDLSRLADNSITATSQAAGNMMSSNEQAMTAPGSQPVDPLPPTDDQNTPDLTMSGEIEPGDTGKDNPRSSEWDPPHPAWQKTESANPEYIDPPRNPEVTGRATEASIGVSPLARGGASGRPAGARAAAASTVNSILGGSDN